MIPNEKYREIASHLLERSRAEKVNWQRPRRVHDANGGYEVRLPESMIRVLFYSPRTQPDYVRISLCKPNGEAVGDWLVEAGDEDWELAHNLFSEAHRLVSGWDRVLNDIEKSISTEGVIGLPVGEATQSGV